MKILIMSSYPPDRCGVASYTVQVAATLRRQGNHVEIVSPDPSAAQHVADYSRTVSGLLQVLALSRRADRTIVEFFPDLLFRPGRIPFLRRPSFVLRWATACALFAFGRQVELVIHEAPYQSLTGRTDMRGRIGRAMWRILVTRPAATFVHTEWERQRLADATGAGIERIRVAQHGETFVKHATADRELARRELGLAEGEFHFLSIGFLQPHKGFDRAMTAMAGLQSDRVRLHVVGSVRVQSRDVLRHVEHLRQLAATIPGVTMHEEYVSDEAFDRWIVACDALVLPYRDIWSSGVVERAKLYGRPAIVSDVGGLRDQADASIRVVRDDGELRQAMAELAEVPAGPTVALAAPVVAEPRSYASAVEVVRERARGLQERHAPRTVTTPGLRSNGRRTLPPPLALPDVPAGRDPRSLVKRAMGKLTLWELVPVVKRVNEIRDYLAEREWLRGD